MFNYDVELINFKNKFIQRMYEFTLNSKMITNINHPSVMAERKDERNSNQTIEWTDGWRTNSRQMAAKFHLRDGYKLTSNWKAERKNSPEVAFLLSSHPDMNEPIIGYNVIEYYMEKHRDAAEILKSSMGIKVNRINKVMNIINLVMGTFNP